MRRVMHDACLYTFIYIAIMNEKITFAANVLLLDVAFMNRVVETIRRPAGGEERPELPLIAWDEWLPYLMLDAGLKPGANEIQVLLLHEAGEDRVKCCSPAELNRLDSRACSTPLGEFQFSCVPTAGMTSTKELFLDLTQLALDAAEVQRLVLLPHHAAYGEVLVERLVTLFHDKPSLAGKTVYFALQPGDVTLPCKVDTAFYSLAKAFRL